MNRYNSLDYLHNSKSLWQHRTIWQEHSAKDFASYESYKRAGILYVFPPFITARMGQKIGRRPQTQLCGDALYYLRHQALENCNIFALFSHTTSTKMPFWGALQNNQLCSSSKGDPLCPRSQLVPSCIVIDNVS